LEIVRNLTRYKEEIRNIILNKDESAFAQHILNKRSQYGPMTVIMVENAKKKGGGEHHEYKRKLPYISL
jgi:hypothetical protein